MKEKCFESPFYTDKIFVGVSERDSQPYIKYPIIDHGDGIVHFTHRVAWEAFKKAIKQAEEEANFVDEGEELTAKEWRALGKSCMRIAKELEEEDC